MRQFGRPHLGTGQKLVTWGEGALKDKFDKLAPFIKIALIEAAL